MGAVSCDSNYSQKIIAYEKVVSKYHNGTLVENVKIAYT
jgi:hypothetical protein